MDGEQIAMRRPVWFFLQSPYPHLMLTKYLEINEDNVCVDAPSAFFLH